MSSKQHKRGGSMVVPPSGVRAFIAKMEQVNRAGRADEEAKKRVARGELKPEDVAAFKQKFIGSDEAPTRCFKCRMNIPEEGQMMRFGEATYHPSCFRCTRCRKNLKDNILCVSGFNFHDSCLSCQECSKSLAGGSISCNTATGELYCGQHSYLSNPNRVIDKVKCNGCKMLANPESDKVIEALGYKFHAKCFKCTSCKQPLMGENGVQATYWIMEDKAYCDPDYQKNFVEVLTCHSCGHGVVDDEYMSLSDDINYHPGCFKCATCQTQLGGDFKVKDDKLYCPKH